MPKPSNTLPKNTLPVTKWIYPCYWSHCNQEVKSLLFHCETKLKMKPIEKTGGIFGFSYTRV